MIAKKTHSLSTFELKSFFITAGLMMKVHVKVT